MKLQNENKNKEFFFIEISLCFSTHKTKKIININKITNYWETNTSEYSVNLQKT